MAFDSRTCRGAAARGHINVLKYLKSERVIFGSETCCGAAMEGHIKLLKYLKSEGVAFDSESCKSAAMEGHFEVLKWLRSKEMNCPWNVQECLMGVKYCTFRLKASAYSMKRCLRG